MSYFLTLQNLYVEFSSDKHLRLCEMELLQGLLWIQLARIVSDGYRTRFEAFII